MSYRKVIKKKDAINSYQTWRDKTLSEDNRTQGAEVLKAEPDLMAAPEETTSPELEAALEALNDGALTTLTALQQKVFQLSVVEGMSNRQVADQLHIGEKGVREHLKLIGKKLHREAVKRL